MLISRGGSAPQRMGTGLYAQVVDFLGREIVNGDIEPGTIVYADQLCDRLGVSRSVIREGVRTLSSMGLVEARPQVGTRVLPRESWDLLNPNVVMWRAEGPGYVEQMRELLELRLGVEHVAAGLAAARISSEEAEKILACARGMEEALETNDARKFFEIDSEFHRLLLRGSQNYLMAQLADTISAAFDVRGRDTRPGMHTLTRPAVRKHLELAQAVSARNVEEAQKKALELVELTLEEFEQTHAGGAAT